MAFLMFTFILWLSGKLDNDYKAGCMILSLLEIMMELGIFAVWLNGGN